MSSDTPLSSYSANEQLMLEFIADRPDGRELGERHKQVATVLFSSGLVTLRGSNGPGAYVAKLTPAGRALMGPVSAPDRQNRDSVFADVRAALADAEYVDVTRAENLRLQDEVDALRAQLADEDKRLRFDLRKLGDERHPFRGHADAFTLGHRAELVDEQMPD